MEQKRRQWLLRPFKPNTIFVNISILPICPFVLPMRLFGHLWKCTPAPGEFLFVLCVMRSRDTKCIVARFTRSPENGCTFTVVLCIAPHLMQLNAYICSFVVCVCVCGFIDGQSCDASMQRVHAQCGNEAERVTATIYQNLLACAKIALDQPTVCVFASVVVGQLGSHSPIRVVSQRAYTPTND